MNKLTCRECPYFWTEDDEEYPSCHYESLGSWDPAPCEQPDNDKCSGDCDNCKYAYNEDLDPVDWIDKHGITFSETGRITMNKELIKQQLNAFYGWLAKSTDLEVCATNLIKDDIVESTKHISAAHAYQETRDLFFEVLEHIEILMKEEK